MKIGVRPVGNFNRWVIHNNLTPEQFWTGSDWSENYDSAVLYDDLGQTSKLANDMQKALLRGLSRRVYKATIEVEVYSERPIPLEDLRNYCFGATSLDLDYDLYGTGPDNSHVVASIDWRKLRVKNG